MSSAPVSILNGSPARQTSAPARSRGSSFRCGACGAVVAKWVGRCEGCDAWGTIEEHTSSPATVGAPAPRSPAVPIGEVVASTRPALRSGLSEVDRVTSGGLTRGSVTLLAGEPGVGKSTLALQMASAVAAVGQRVLYVSAEESPPQVRARAVRLGPLSEHLWLSAEADVEAIVGEMNRVGPVLAVIDSIQTVSRADATAGAVAQVRACAQRLVEAARDLGCAVLLIGHVTKDGSLAGPRQLEHLVDSVLTFDGDRHDALRLLRAVKHRFGPTSELGLLEMTAAGLIDVLDPSRLLLADRRPGAHGSVVLPLLDGRRALLVELQALVVRGVGNPARRSVQGIDGARLAVLLAVLGRVLGLAVLDAEVYCLAVGGVQVDDPGADLALAAALVSSLFGRPLPADVVLCGEVGLGGEVRSVRYLDRRLREAVRAGFRRAVVPAEAADIAGIELVRVPSVADALMAVGVLRGDSGAASEGPRAFRSVDRSGPATGPPPMEKIQSAGGAGVRRAAG